MCPKKPIFGELHPLTFMVMEQNATVIPQKYKVQKAEILPENTYDARAWYSIQKVEIYTKPK